MTVVQFLIRTNIYGFEIGRFEIITRGYKYRNIFTFGGSYWGAINSSKLIARSRPLVSFKLAAKAAEGFVPGNLHEICTKSSQNFSKQKAFGLDNCKFYCEKALATIIMILKILT